MNTIKKIISLNLGVLLLFALACKKDKTSKTGAPELTTTEITNIMATTAMSGGSVTSNGGETIVASGVCWSKVNNMPTVSDDTTKSTTAISGSFTAVLKNLTPSATYYVRAYATNRNGTGYGNVIIFSTGNGAPVATGVSISGTAVADALLTGNYTYTDAENNTEQGTTFQWYTANDGLGAGEAVIPGATAKTFRVQDAQRGKYIRFGVTPKASTGNLTGLEVKSAYVGAVGEGSTVTFTYNGVEVTYGILISAKTGRKWLDRNLGASRVAQSPTDYDAYGDLFQWGRLADGHQRVTRTQSSTTAVTGVTAMNAYSTTDVPPNNKFIIASGNSGDWRTPQNNNLWQGVEGVNNPCPTGWRLPASAEWKEEGISSAAQAFDKFKMPYTGSRNYWDGQFEYAGEYGFYWTSTSIVSGGKLYSSNFSFAPSEYYESSEGSRAYGMACRCIKQ